MAEYSAWQSIEDFDIFRDLERLCDEVWELVTPWQPLARDTIGKQLVRACDSVGANLAEADGRYHHKDKLNHYYIARGSLKEVRYWLRRAVARGFLSSSQSDSLDQRLERTRRWINSLISQRRKWIDEVREEPAEYAVEAIDGEPVSFGSG